MTAALLQYLSVHAILIGQKFVDNLRLFILCVLDVLIFCHIAKAIVTLEEKM